MHRRVVAVNKPTGTGNDLCRRNSCSRRHVRAGKKPKGTARTRGGSPNSAIHGQRTARNVDVADGHKEPGGVDVRSRSLDGT